MGGAMSWGQDWQGLKDPSVGPAQISLDPLHSFEGHMYPQETNRHGTHNPTPSARAAPPLWTHPHDTQRPVSPRSPCFSMPQPKSPPLPNSPRKGCVHTDLSRPLHVDTDFSGSHEDWVEA